MIALTKQCLSAEAIDRPRDAQEVVDGLSAYLNGVQERLQTAERERAVAVAREAEQRKRRQVQLTLTAAVVLVLVAGIVVSGYFAYAASEEANAALKAETEAVTQRRRADAKTEEAETNLGLAKQSEANAKQSEKLAKENEEKAVVQEQRTRQEKERGDHLLALAEIRPYVCRLGQAQQEGSNGNWSKVEEILQGCQWNVRNIGFRLLWSRFVNKRTLAMQIIHDITLSADGNYILAANGGLTKIWDLRSGTEIHSYEHGMSHPRFSPDGKRILGVSDQVGKLWDLQTGNELLVLKGHSLVSCVAWSADGKRVLTGCRNGEVKVWDADQGTELLTIKHSPVNSVAFSPDALRILTGTTGGARIWDARTGRELLSLEGSKDGVSALSFSPDGQRIVSSGSRVTIWDSQTGKPVRTLKDALKGAAFSPDSNFVVAGYIDRTARVWDVQTGEQVLRLGEHRVLVPGAPRQVDYTAWSSNSETIVTACTATHTAAPE